MRTGAAIQTTKRVMLKSSGRRGGHMAASQVRLKALIAVAILLSCAPITKAHDPSTYVIILRNDGPMPTNVTAGLFTGDSVMFRDVDSTENVTHRVLMDGDGDGFYDNQSVDWDSGPLTNVCELDQEGNKSDPDCEVTFIVAFNETTGFGAGIYHYIVESSTGGNHSGMIRIVLDDHSGENEGPEPGYSFGNDGDTNDDGNDVSDGQSNYERLAAVGGAETLLVLSATTMLLAIYIFARIGASLDGPPSLANSSKEAKADAKSRGASNDEDSKD